MISIKIDIRAGLSTDFIIACRNQIPRYLKYIYCRGKAKSVIERTTACDITKKKFLKMPQGS